MKQIIVDGISTWYYITEDGKCYNEKTRKYLKGQVNCRSGYFSYMITLPDGSKKRLPAHRLVALAYLPEQQTLEKNQVNHKDGNKLNNCIDNLEWVSPSENQQHALDNELRKFDHVFCFDKNKRLVAEYKNISEAVKATGVSKFTICQEVNKEVKELSGGFYWGREPVLGETKSYPNLGKAKEVYQYDKNGKFIHSYPSLAEAARALGLARGTRIGECCRGKLKSCAGFVWRYAEDIVSPSEETQREVSETSQD